MSGRKPGIEGSSSSQVANTRKVRRRYEGTKFWLHKPQSVAKRIIANRAAHPVIAFVLAAQLIQKRIRGFLTRARFRKALAIRASGEPFSIGELFRRSSSRLSVRVRLPHARQVDGHTGGGEAGIVPASFLPPEECIRRLQARIRMILTRKVYQRIVFYGKCEVYDAAATQLQTLYRSFKQKQYMTRQRRQFFTKEDLAAVKIQNMWRGFVNKQIYSFYRDLIKFREKGDPASMLRCINPREARLMDAASGIHVRFRLGGSAFPPSIFYKIFTHNPLIDICAFAPRDYAEQRRLAGNQGAGKRPKTRAGDVSRIMTGSGKKDKDHDRGRWYQRVENNGWRPINTDLLKDPDGFVAAEKERKTNERRSMVFHWSRQKRKEDKERDRKKKKVEWMKRLYQEAKGGNPSKAGPARGKASASADDLIDDLPGFGEGDEDLLNWSQALDYDRYRDDWLSLATTLGSDYTVLDKGYSEADPDIVDASDLETRSRERIAALLRGDSSPYQ